MPDHKKIAASRKGGANRAKSLSRAERIRIAKAGGKALWARIRAGKLTSENN